MSREIWDIQIHPNYFFMLNKTKKMWNDFVNHGRKNDIILDTLHANGESPKKKQKSNHRRKNHTGTN